MEVLVTEITDDAKFYGCTVSDGPALEKLMESLREEFTSNPPLAGAYQPKRNDLCAAKFVDDQWYRARVEKVGTSDAQVNISDLSKIFLNCLTSDFLSVLYNYFMVGNSLV